MWPSGGCCPGEAVGRITRSGVSYVTDRGVWLSLLAPTLELGTRIKEAVSYSSGHGDLGPATTRIIVWFSGQVAADCGTELHFYIWLAVCMPSLSIYNSFWQVRVSWPWKMYLHLIQRLLSTAHPQNLVYLQSH